MNNKTTSKNIYNYSSGVSIGDIPLLYWSVYFTILWNVLFISYFFLNVFYHLAVLIGDALEFSYGRYVEKRLLFIHYLKRYISCIITVGVADSLLFFFNGKKDSQISWISLAHSIISSLLVTVVALFVHKVIVLQISTSFHDSVYGERINKYNFSLFVITTLAKALEDINLPTRNSDEQISIPSGSQEFISKRDIKPLPVKNYMNNVEEFMERKIKKISSFSVKELSDKYVLLNTSLIGFFYLIVDIRTKEKAEELASKIFASLSKGKSSFSLQDIAPYFPSEDIALKGFDLIDIDDNNAVGPGEFQKFINDLLLEKISIDSSLNDMENSVESLSKILFFFILFIILWIILGIFQIPLQSYVVTASSFILASAFMIRESANDFFSSIIYVFFKHPYDVGDLVIVDSEKYNVKKIYILNTEFIAKDGKDAVIQNSLLSKKNIINISRSEILCEVIKITIPLETSEKSLKMLEKKVDEFVKRNSKL